jgi:hypothetical protein
MFGRKAKEEKTRRIFAVFSKLIITQSVRMDNLTGNGLI